MRTLQATGSSGLASRNRTTLDFCLWLMEHRPELLPKGVGDPCQLLRAEFAVCTDT